MKLDVQPLRALCDKKIDIHVSELPPLEKVKIMASMNLPWAENLTYESMAWFTSDSDGNLDISKKKPDSGDYDFVDSMGLIVSMKRTSGDLKDVVQNISVDSSIFLDITVECGDDKASVKLERFFKSPELKNLKITQEFVGELFYTENNTDKTILLLGGSGGSLNANLPMAAVLASHGFNVLTVAYFSEEGLPSHLSEIPLEYFEKVFAWLSNNRMTQNREIQVFGISKGGELAMLLASRYPFITKVAAMAPHAYCFQGLAFKNVSSWTYDGEELPFIRLKNRWVFKNMITCMIKNEPFGFTHTYKKGLNAARNKEAARIKIENAEADMLLFATLENNMWNTYDGCTQITDTLRKTNYQHEYDLVVYEDAGEPFYVPYVLPATETSSEMAPRLTLSMGGTLKGNAHAQADSWERTIEFFKEK